MKARKIIETLLTLVAGPPLITTLILVLIGVVIMVPIIGAFVIGVALIVNALFFWTFLSFITNPLGGLPPLEVAWRIVKGDLQGSMIIGLIMLFSEASCLSVAIARLREE